MRNSDETAGSATSKLKCSGSIKAHLCKSLLTKDGRAPKGAEPYLEFLPLILSHSQKQLIRVSFEGLRLQDHAMELEPHKAVVGESGLPDM